MIKTPAYELRPGITNPSLQYRQRPPERKWNIIKKLVHERDAFTCQFCGHTAYESMNVHYLDEAGANEPDNLFTCCVACHAVMHIRSNLSLGTIEIWESEISQALIIQFTRDSVRNGLPLEYIITQLPLREGKYKPDSAEYANSLVATIGVNPRGTLEIPYCAVFTDFEMWQIDYAT